VLWVRDFSDLNRSESASCCLLTMQSICNKSEVLYFQLTVLLTQLTTPITEMCRIDSAQTKARKY
jgi:hypothetical protein